MENTNERNTLFNLHKQEKFRKDALSFGFRFWMLAKLPMAWLAGLKVKSLSAESCSVSVKHKWLNQNPFRSTYFAVLAMAAEMPTGLLGMQYIRSSKKKISILVVDLHADFIKKAVGTTTFTCTQGAAFKETVERAIASGEGETIKTESIGLDKDGNEIAKFWITWSMKVKSNA